MQQRAQKTTNRPRGFTLLELIAAVGIIATLAALSYASLDRMLGRAQARGAYQELVAAMQQARDEALIRGVPTVFRIVPSSPSTPDQGLSFRGFVDPRSDFDFATPGASNSAFTLLSQGELPPSLSFDDQVGSVTLPAPYSKVPTSGTCSFCETNGEAIIVFGSDGSARLGSTPGAHPLGGSLALVDSIKNEKFTVAILSRGIIRSFER